MDYVRLYLYFRAALDSRFFRDKVVPSAMLPCHVPAHPSVVLPKYCHAHGSSGREGPSHLSLMLGKLNSRLPSSSRPG